MDISLKVVNPHWDLVYKIPQNQLLVKGRHDQYHQIVTEAGKIRERFGCYAWGSPNSIFYVGSFSKDYQHGDYKSNLHGRVHNYLQNHRVKETGQKNTNLMVFESINQALFVSDVCLFIYRLDHLEMSGERVGFSNYSADAHIVRALEQLLICSFKRVGQCDWNRE